MKKTSAAPRTTEQVSASVTGIVIGKIIRVNDSGQIQVDYPGNPAGPAPARITASVQKELLGKGDPAGREVLLAFVHNDLRQPVIVDAMYSVLEDIMGAPVIESERPQEAVLDGKRIVLNAEEEIVLQCGKASITLTKSGKVLIQGEYLSSHSRGVNKIKGGSIQLN
jgi:hypothetical protein